VRNDPLNNADPTGRQNMALEMQREVAENRILENCADAACVRTEIAALNQREAQNAALIGAVLLGVAGGPVLSTLSRAAAPAEAATAAAGTEAAAGQAATGGLRSSLMRTTTNVSPGTEGTVATTRTATANLPANPLTGSTTRVGVASNGAQELGALEAPRHLRSVPPRPLPGSQIRY